MRVKIYKPREGTSSAEPIDIKAVFIDSNVEMEQFKGNMMSYDETYKMELVCKLSGERSQLCKQIDNNLFFIYF